MIQIEIFGGIGKRMDHDSPDSNIFSDPMTPKHRIMKQIRTQSLPTEREIYCQACEYNDRDRVRHIPAQAAGSISVIDATGSEGIKACNLFCVLPADDKCSGSS